MDVERARAWEERYRAGQTGWDRGGVSPALLHWLDSGRLTPCRILVPGCGYGHEVVELARRGFEVWGLDIAPSPLARLRVQLDAEDLDARLVQADVLTWQAVQPFDAIYEQTCLCALAPAEWADYARQLHGWLRPGGELYALFMQTHAPGGPPYHCDLGEMRTLFDQALWDWVEPPQRRVPHPSGRYEYAAVLRRRA
ncbi:MAG: TPMT family class I SAM-dependent methyltransferase [Thiobacillaceae bacterium]|nr:TPMT family class I SAM-dependent methyltransferase [Thiobacillaceae bacterium]MDW8324212.1 methyltransferase domain-containing protein [Burkholderiales bacterium]